MPRTVAALLLLAGLCAAGAIAASSPTRTSFANGSWSGSARLVQKIEGFSFTATSSFTMKIRGGRASGRVISRGSGGGAIQGTSLKVAVSGVLPLTGRASAPSARGTLKFSATSQGKTESGSIPGAVTLSKLRGTCDRMTGTLSVRLADATQLLSAPFTAVRAAGGPRC